MKNSIMQHMRFFILLLVPLQPGCTHRKQLIKENLVINNTSQQQPLIQNTTTELPPRITIWVHGTILFNRGLHQQTFNTQSGLFLIDSLPEDNPFYCIANTISKKNPAQFPFEQFYIFAWSGKLSAKERKAASKKLHHDLNSVIEWYKIQHGTYPTIQIIAHSHGGNVVLHVAKNQYLTPISIESLVLLACPVQEKTMHLVNMPMFKHIYSLYSSIDMIQIIAPQMKNHVYKGRHRYKIPAFSARRFPTFSHVIQTKVKMNGYPLTHTGFTRTKFIQILPDVLQKLDDWDTFIQKEGLKEKHKLLCIQLRN